MTFGVDHAGPDESRRAAGLVAAQEKAVALFDETAARGLVAPGVGEREVSDRIRDLANEMFGTTKHWHKRIIRSGPNTLLPYRENPPDRTIGEDDVAFADFGPIFEEYEADFGRTYVFGDDPHKHRLLDDLPGSSTRDGPSSPPTPPSPAAGSTPRWNVSRGRRGGRSASGTPGTS
ncbi:hypothetical protein Smic_01070 [Streptomyces microflavus]|uniref:Peptidase M24 domain-containing protein n=1 Tax=Streptomyces microflavus TaxID=1919 RepID=A0A7J0CGB5_STRMI|nr:hypothetical protein Smic_01070 [Streptomyces microflavus]